MTLVDARDPPPLPLGWKTRSNQQEHRSAQMFALMRPQLQSVHVGRRLDDALNTKPRIQ